MKRFDHREKAKISTVFLFQFSPDQNEISSKWIIESFSTSLFKFRFDPGWTIFIDIFECFLEKHAENFRVEARKLIDYYQLNKFQLVFSIVELCGETSQPIVYEQTSAYSVVVSSPHFILNRVTEIHYAPKESNGQYSEEILLYIPQLGRRKGMTFSSRFVTSLKFFLILDTTVFIEFPSRNTRVLVPSSTIDTKIISCQSPACSSENDEQECAAFIVVQQNQTSIARLPFLYRFSKFLESLKFHCIVFFFISENDFWQLQFNHFCKLLFLALFLQIATNFLFCQQKNKIT